MEFTAEMIAGAIGGEVVGDKTATVNTFAKITEGHQGALSFLANPKYEHYIYTTRSSVVIVNRSFEPEQPVPATMIRVEDAYGAFAKLLELYVANKPRRTGISERAAIDPSARLGKDCYVGDFAVVDAGAVIGDNCQIFPQAYIGTKVRIGNNVTINSGVKIYEECVLGNNVTLHAGCVIGADGFGFAPNAQGSFDKIPQIGNVVIEDDVEIGANTCVDRATMGSTLIRKGVKLDNLIQIGHNVVIGENTVAAAQVGIAGSTQVGHNCMFGGQVGIAGHLSIGDNVKAGSQSGIDNNVESNDTRMGTPSLSGIKFHRSNAIFRNLPELSRTVSRLEKQVAELMAEKQ